MRPLILIVAGLLVLPATFASSQEQSSVTLIIAEDDELGPFVADDTGRPVYAFLTSETIGGDGLDPLDSCHEACRNEWPPVTVSGDVRVGDGVDPDLVGTRPGGEAGMIVTYNDYALFHFHRDTSGEPPEGQGIYSYGGYWALLGPNGTAIRTGPMEELDQLPEVPSDD